MNEPAVTTTMRDALAELKRHEENGNPYWWRRASMLKLAALGLVEPWHPLGKGTKSTAYRTTQAGRDYTP